MVESTVQLLLAHQAGRRTKPSVSLRSSCSTVLLMLKQDRFKQRSINVVVVVVVVVVSNKKLAAMG